MQFPVRRRFYLRQNYNNRYRPGPKPNRDNNILYNLSKSNEIMKIKYLLFIIILVLLSSCCHFNSDKIAGMYSCQSDKGYEEIILKKNNTFIYYAQDKDYRSYLDSGNWRIYTDMYAAIEMVSIKDFLLIYTDSSIIKYENKDSSFYKSSKGRVWHFQCNKTIERFPDKPYDFKRRKELYYLKNK